MLDEAFDKADAEFTTMAMRIFEAFGFQMIVATPLKSVMTMEPFIGSACFVHIRDRKNSSVLMIEYDEEKKTLRLPGPDTQSSVSVTSGARSAVLLPDDIQCLLARRFRNRHRDWFDGAGAWPMSLALDAPNEQEAGSEPAAARQWVEAWNRVSGLPGEITWESKKWRRLGTQRLPVRLALSSAQDVAAWVGETVRWELACHRRSKLTERWSAFGHPGILSRKFEVLADYADVDFERLVNLLDWLVAHPSSGLFAIEHAERAPQIHFVVGACHNSSIPT